MRKILAAILCLFAAPLFAASCGYTMPTVKAPVPDSQLATISTAGKISDTALSANVPVQDANGAISLRRKVVHIVAGDSPYTINPAVDGYDTLFTLDNAAPVTVILPDATNNPATNGMVYTFFCDNVNVIPSILSGMSQCICMLKADGTSQGGTVLSLATPKGYSSVTVMSANIGGSTHDSRSGTPGWNVIAYIGAWQSVNP